jgi:hypothetical protein
MRRLAAAALALALTLLLPATQALAWNGKGHKVVAYVAYQKMSPQLRDRAFQLLRQHPDFATLVSFSGLPPNFNQSLPNNRLRVFMTAAIWPDIIKKDGRFYDETDPDELPTPPVPGFPDMKKHKPWHYIDLPIPGQWPTSPPPRDNALRTMRAFRHSLGSANVTQGNKAYFMSWMLHIVGDVHQPLHCAARFTEEYHPPDYPDGDRGGNRFPIAPFPIPEADYSADNLHSFWDGLLGADTRLPAVRALGDQIIAEQPAPGSVLIVRC